MKVRRSVLKDTVVLRTRTGEGSYGDSLAAAVTVPCLLDETRRLVRDAAGQQVVSEVQLVLHPRTRAVAADGKVTELDPMDVFTTESEVQVGNRVSRVLTAKEDRQRGYTVSVTVVCT